MFYLGQRFHQVPHDLVLVFRQDPVEGGSPFAILSQHKEAGVFLLRGRGRTVVFKVFVWNAVITVPRKPGFPSLSHTLPRVFQHEEVSSLPQKECPYPFPILLPTGLGSGFEGEGVHLQLRVRRD